VIGVAVESGLLLALAVAATFAAGIVAASTYVAIRRARLRAEDTRRVSRDVREALTLLGDALAATHNPRALLGVILEATVGATHAAGGAVVVDGRVAERIGAETAETPLVLALAEGGTEEAQLLLYPPAGGFADETKQLAASIALQGRVALENARLHETVARQALADDLTGLANRRRFMQSLDGEVRRAERFGTRLSVLVADLDNFKSINDRFGHAAGDLVLQRVAEILSSTLRDVDLPARLGGEEFAVIVQGSDVDAAIVVGERIRDALRSSPIELAPARSVTVTASLGIASYPEEPTPEALMRAADVALYRAKAEGKDRTVSSRR